MRPPPKIQRAPSILGRPSSYVIGFITFLAVAWPWKSGHLERIEHHFADLRSIYLQQEVETDIVIIGIDALSISELSDWPWPRRYHAMLLERLGPTEPARVFLNVDFSARADDDEDALFEEALAAWHEIPIVLPAFFQQTTGTNTELTYTRPAYLPYVDLAWVTLRPGRDGLVRSVRTSWRLEDEDLPSLTALVPDVDLVPDVEMPIDFTISPSSFEYVSYRDVLEGRVLPSQLRGKDIYVGAFAIELGDSLPVPVFQSLPGAVLLATAAHTARQGTLWQLSANTYVLLLGLWVTVLVIASSHQSWRRNLLTIGICLLLICATSFYVYQAHRLVLDGLPPMMVALLIFMSTTIRALNDHTRDLEYRATHDPLTALPNRTALSSHLARVLTRDLPGHVTLMLLDLCRFKEVNDTLGHEIGDRVLVEVARRFQAALNGKGFIARIGGDEFTAVMTGRHGSEGVPEIAGQLSDSLKAPIHVDGISIDLGVSVGVARYPDDGRDAQTLLRHADIAMYMAKRRGETMVYYDSTRDEHSVRRLTMVSELRDAISEGQLRLHYQPIVNLRTGKSDRVEALLRWRHRKLGDVPPAEFVGLAEKTDLIEPLTLWTLEEALRQVSRWRSKGLAPGVAVNLSARMLQDTDFPSWLRRILDRSGIEPEALELEITESAMIVSPPRALDILRRIRGLGVTIAVDDFGTGFSSLQYLRDIPANVLKLDTTFVMNMGQSRNDRIIVSSAIRMAHALGLLVVAEGVQSEIEMTLLAGSDCDYAQGYLFAPALPAEACTAWLKRFGASRGLSPCDPRGQLQPRSDGKR